MTNTELQGLAVLAAREHGLEPALVCALIEQESGWNPWAVRYEPNYRWLWAVGEEKPWRAPAAFAAPRGVSVQTEFMQQKTSWGLLQVMGAVARERGCREPFLSVLCRAELGLAFGCLHLKVLAARWGPEQREVLQRWNGGSNPRYAEEVLARKGKYV